MNNKNSKSLEEFLSFFPMVDLPVTVSGEVITTFSAQNPPLPLKLIDKFFSEWESFDEYTEIVPCFSLPSLNQINILVYWKGGLMSYEFVIITLSPDARLIAKKVIAGTISNNKTVKESVAVISEDYTIYSVVGESDIHSRTYVPTNSNSFKFEILPDGTILSIQDDTNTWESENIERKN